MLIPPGFLKLSYENGKIATFVNIIKTLNNIITGDNESNAIEKGLENINTLKTLIENGGLNEDVAKKMIQLLIFNPFIAVVMNIMKNDTVLNISSITMNY